jgi:hypothetical protein
VRDNHGPQSGPSTRDSRLVTRTSSLPGGGKLTVSHTGRGGRQVVEERNGAGIVSEGRRGGYVQRPYMTRNGRSYYQRTYVAGGHVYARAYRGFDYQGVRYYAYTPAFYYQPAFYAWAGGPWAAPVYFGPAAWGWVGAPWFAYYGFVPYPSYASPALWLTDYLMAADLEAAYAAMAAPALAVPGGISVDARLPWTDTGIQVVQGQAYSLLAGGTISYNTNASDGAPATPVGRSDTDGCFPGQFHPNMMYPNLPCISLVGKIGLAGIPFEVGNSMTLVPAHSGELFLGLNESTNANSFSDNAGAWAVSINPVGANNAGPEPAQPAAADAGQSTPTPEIKQAIADEVRAQLAAEQAVAANSSVTPAQSADQVPDALNPAQRVFVVSSALDVTLPNGQSCSLTPGDVVMRITDAPDGNQNVNASVQGSKKSDCARGQTVAIGVQDLQEMHNQFQERVDSGMQKLAANAGRGGLPAAPATGTVPGAVPAPPPDAAAAAQLAGAQQDADLSEKAVEQTSGS